MTAKHHDKHGDRDAYGTPKRIMDAVSRVMGAPPTIDFCASAGNTKAPLWVGVDGRGTAGPGPIQTTDPHKMAKVVGGGWGWMNPPYSRDNIRECLAWAARFVQAGGTVAVLVNADESTGWFRAMHPHVRLRLIPRERIQFDPPPGVDVSKNNRSQSIYIMAPHRPWDLAPGRFVSQPLGEEE